MKKIKGLIISGFPGVGKTAAGQRCRDIADIESTAFHYPIDWENINDPEKMRHEENPNWVKEYVDHIEDTASQQCFCYCLVSSHDHVREEMDARSIPYIVVVPEVELKDEYLARYVKRGSDFPFIKCMDDHWYEWLNEIEQSGVPIIHLKAGQFISDILPIPPR